MRNQAFYIDSLYEIKKQEHLISLYERIILKILMADVKLSRVYPYCSFMSRYFTSIKSNYIQSSWSSSEYEKYLQYDEIFNGSYYNIYCSIGIVKFRDRYYAKIFLKLFKSFLFQTKKRKESTIEF